MFEQPIQYEKYNISLLKEHDLDPADPKILDKVIEHYKDIVGEEHNIKIVFLAAISRKLPKKLRMHIVNYSSSGTGKSWITRKVLKPFWEHVEEITKYTEAWLNSAVDELDEKILLLQEINKTDDQGKGITGQIKILLSDEGISYRLMVMGESGWIPQNKQSNALPVVITTTTKQMNDEDQRRFFILSADESTAQTAAIIEHNMNKASSVKLQKSIEEDYEHLIPLARFYEDAANEITGIIVPYAKQAAEILPNNLEMRTISTKLIQLTQLVAFTHIMNRRIIITESQERFLIADVEDITEALNIANKIFAHNISGLSSGSLKIIETIRGLITNGGGYSFEICWPRLQSCIDSSGFRRGTFYHHLKPLLQKGYVVNRKVADSTEHVLELTDSIVELKEKELEFTQSDLIKWFETEFGNSAKLVDFADTYRRMDS